MNFVSKLHNIIHPRGHGPLSYPRRPSSYTRMQLQIQAEINERRNIFNTFVLGQFHQGGEQAHLLEQC